MGEQKKGKCKRAGKNKVKCERYRLNRARPNKLRKLARHIAKHPNDDLAKAAQHKVQHTI